MTIQVLHERLARLGISEDRYFLHGLYGSSDDNDKIAMTIKRSKYAIEYEVYYREKGVKDSIRTFMTEGEACDYILREFERYSAI